MGSGSSTQASPDAGVLKGVQKVASRSREWLPDIQGKEPYHAVEYAVLEKLMRGLRSEQMRKEFAKVSEGDYTSTEEFRIWVGTYNVNGRQLDKGVTLDKLLTQWDSNWPTKANAGDDVEEERADIYIMGFQEVVPLNAQNIAGAWSSANAASWDTAIDHSLNPWKRSEGSINTEESESKDNSDNGDINVVDLLSGWSGVLSETHRVAQKKNVEAIVEASSDLESGTVDDADDPSKDSEEKSPDLHPFGKVDTFNYDNGYVQIVSRQLCGVYLSIWVRRSMLPKVTGIQTTYVATGALGYLANKGAIAARMRINDSSLVVVTSHFASGDHVGDEIKRNLDFSEIMRRVEFAHERNIAVDGDLEGLPPGARSEVKRAYLGGSWGACRKLHNHENIVWLGDLNYRIQGNNPAVVQAVRASRLDRLYAFDELQRERGAGRAFDGFKEAPITFPPTYKYNRGTNYYTGELNDDASSSDSEDEQQVSKSGSTTDKGEGDALGINPFQQVRRSRGVDGELGQSSGFSEESAKDAASEKGSTTSSAVAKPKKKSKKPKKIRTPSWTDRILYYTNGRLHHLLYGSCMDMMMSDHKPVCSAFLLQSKLLDKEAVEQHFDKCRRAVDEREMAIIPRCRLEPNQVDFGSVKYKERHTSSLFVVNTGEVPAMFGFIPPPETAFDGSAQHGRPLPPWISADPVAGEVMPGEKAEISLTIHVTGGMWGTANELAAYPDGKLDEVLIIRVEGGSDCFIQISGIYELSAFGLSLERLAGKKPQKDPSRTLQSHRVDLASMRYRSQSDPLELMEYLPEVLEEAEKSEVPPQSAFAPLTRTGPRPNIVEGPIGEMIPSQLSKMLHHLCKNDRLNTTNLFVGGLKELLKSEKRNGDDEEVATIRKILDNEDSIPSTIGGKQIGKALLSFFIDLPAPLIPESVAQAVVHSKVQKEVAATLTKEAMTAVEWGVMRTTLEVFRTALTPEHAAENGLTISALASVLAEVWFRSTELEPGAVYTEEEKISIKIAKAQQKQRQAKYMEYFLQLPVAEE